MQKVVESFLQGYCKKALVFSYSLSICSTISLEPYWKSAVSQSVTVTCLDLSALLKEAV